NAHEQPKSPNGFVFAELPANWGLEIDCADIRDVLLTKAPIPPNPPLPPPPPDPVFIKGWVVIEVPLPNGNDPRPLDVVAVYPGHGLASGVPPANLVPEGFSLDVERINATTVSK